MSAPDRYDAVVLRRTDYGEADRIVTLFTREEGLVRGIAKNARASRKRFGGALELFARVRVDPALKARRGGEGALARFQSAELVEPFLGLRSSLEALQAAAEACEALVLLLHEHERAPALFEALLHFLKETAGGNAARRPELLAWIWLRTLDTAGLSPMLAHCVRCGRDAAELSEAQFRAGEGGIVCGRCAVVRGPEALPAAGVRAFAALAAARDAEALAGVRVTREGAERLQRLTQEFIEHRAGKALRSARRRPAG